MRSRARWDNVHGLDDQQKANGETKKQEERVRKFSDIN